MPSCPPAVALAAPQVYTKLDKELELIKHDMEDIPKRYELNISSDNDGARFKKFMSAGAAWGLAAWLPATACSHSAACCPFGCHDVLPARRRNLCSKPRCPSSMSVNLPCSHRGAGLSSTTRARRKTWWALMPLASCSCWPLRSEAAQHHWECLFLRCERGQQVGAVLQ